MENIISVKNFSKSFGTNIVIKNLNFEVKKGEVFAFLGANGSGKTTTIRTLLGIYEPSEGELLVNDKRFSQEDAYILGYLPEERGLYLSSQVLETMVYFGELKGMPKKDAKDSALAYLAKVGLEDKAKSKIKVLSSGQQQKIQLGITVINKPELLILDEPTKGLDPVNRSLFMDLLFDLKRHGTTILFSTHQMEEAEKIADRVLMIKNGERKLYGEMNEVKSSFGSNTLLIHYKGDFPANPDLYTFKTEGFYAEVSPGVGVSAQDILSFLVSQQLFILKFEVASPSLNEIFITVSNEK